MSVIIEDAEKTYDGTPLTTSEASLEGLVGDETATVTATGTATHVNDSGTNSYSIAWGSANENDYTVTEENLGNLQINPIEVRLDGVYYSSNGTYGLEVICTSPIIPVPDITAISGTSWTVTWNWETSADTFTINLADPNTFTFTGSGTPGTAQTDFVINYTDPDGFVTEE